MKDKKIGEFVDKDVLNRFRLRKGTFKDFSKNLKINNTKLIILLALTLVLGFGMGVASLFVYGKYFGIDATPGNDLSISIKNTYNNLKDNFDGNLDTQKLIDAANKGMVNAASDQYTLYLSSTEAKAFQNDLNGSIGSGIGVELGVRNDRIVILRTLADNPALRAGMQAGDYIVSVDGKSSTGWTAYDAAKNIRGETGTMVKVVVERDGKQITYDLKRETINNLSVDSYLKGDYGVLRILRFDEQTADLAKSAVKDFKSKNVKGIIIDLRNNGGGYVSAARDVVGLWLNNKVVMTERTGDQIIDTIKTGNSAIVQGMKTIVIVNGSSASASEILAGALKDYNAAKIIGEKSFGKGSVQKLVDLIGGAQLKVTVARWYTPNSKNITGQGIEPDVNVVFSSDDMNRGVDNQLEAAISELKK
jgi:carboxyl-terminal processing protease